jgi:DNA repair protein RecN (Recombination protein N)
LLNALTSLLVDLHQQFGHLALKEDNFQVDALDAIGGTMVQAREFQEQYSRHKKVKKQLTENKEKQAQLQKEADYKQFLFDELNEVAFKPEEVENAALQLKQMGHAERITQILVGARTLLEEGEQPLVNELKRVSQQLQGINDIMPGLKPLQERIASVWAELKDISAELSIEEEKVSLNPEVMAELQQRVDIGYKLMKKHGVNTTAELLELQASLEEELKTATDINASIEKLSKEEEKLYKELLAEGEKLSAKRKKAVPGFNTKMNELLVLVGMPNARFEARLEPVAPTLYGIDNVQFMLDANKSGQSLPLEKAASGGEMSRIMLCIKSLTAKALHMPTLIFDEVDTGISGEAARQVGLLLRELSAYHQVICITHQPQVAARGSRHFYVYKQPDTTGRLVTSVRTLEQSERVLAIARMIGGEQPSEAAINNARELVGM